jgi:hypothetical protein
MTIASVTMVGQFPDGIDLHVRNLRWALSENAHIYIITSRSIITDFNLKNDHRLTYIEFSQGNDLHKFIYFWKEFPRIITEHCIEPDWLLLMEQDIWFYEKIKDDPLPGPKEIRSHLPPQINYHCVTIDKHLYHPRVWEGSALLEGAVVRRAIEFGIDFSAHPNWFINKDKEYWDNVAGGELWMGEYEQGDTMDEFTFYCALVEKTRTTHSPRAVHLQGPEVFHRSSPDFYNWREDEAMRAVAQRFDYYFCVYAAVAVYFIAGNWKNEADWKRIQPPCKSKFKRLLRTANEWMKPEEYERLERIGAGI